MKYKKLLLAMVLLLVELTALTGRFYYVNTTNQRLRVRSSYGHPSCGGVSPFYYVFYDIDSFDMVRDTIGGSICGAAFSVDILPQFGDRILASYKQNGSKRGGLFLIRQKNNSHDLEIVHLISDGKVTVVNATGQRMYYYIGYNVCSNNNGHFNNGEYKQFDRGACFATRVNGDVNGSHTNVWTPTFPSIGTRTCFFVFKPRISTSGTPYENVGPLLQDT